MSVGPLIVEITVVFGLVFWFLHRYGNLRKQTVMVTVAAFLSWYFSFLIVVILPLDVSSVSIIDLHLNINSHEEICLLINESDTVQCQCFNCLKYSV